MKVEIETVIGGMLGAWMRMKYPHALHGVIAASAPIWGFMGEVSDPLGPWFVLLSVFSGSKVGPKLL